MPPTDDLLPAEAQPALGEGLGSLRRIVGLHLRLAQNAVYRHFMESLGHLDLTQKQASVLFLIDENPGIAQSDLAARLGMDRATMMAIIDRLEARDVLSRSRSKRDRRRQDLHLTQTGQALVVEARAAVAKHEAWLRARIGAEGEVADFVERLQRIYR